MDPLSQLRDIHLPEPIGLWPPAIGWWLVLAALVMVLLILIGLARRTIAENRAKQELLVQLHRQFDRFGATNDQAEFVRNMNKTLKTIALKQHERAQIATLSGTDWLTFLDHTGDTNRFTQGPGQVLATGPYLAQVELDAQELYELCLEWVKKHD